MTPDVAFALAAVLHAGFQVTVTALVYPALARTPADAWVPVHARHSQVIAPVVAAVYGLLLVTGVVLVVSGPGVLEWAALAATGVALLVTAGWAAPLHGALGERDDRRVARLLVADRLRCAGAVLGAITAVAAVAG